MSRAVFVCECGCEYELNNVPCPLCDWELLEDEDCYWMNIKGDILPRGFNNPDDLARTICECECGCQYEAYDLCQCRDD